MSSEWPTELKFSAQTLEDALMGLGDADDLAYDQQDDDGDELRSMIHGIAGNHVDVVARFARGVFGKSDSIADHQQFASALSSLVRLAEATEDDTLRVLLSDMMVAVVERSTRSELGKDRARFLPRLTRFLEAFAAHLPEADAARLREIVHWEPDRVPLLAEIKGLRGIGPRRLDRLYCCGLYTVETVAHADPGDIAAVCGLPLALSSQVVDAAREFALRERARSLTDARMRIQMFVRMAAALGDTVPEESVQAALAAVANLESSVRPTPAEKR